MVNRSITGLSLFLLCLAINSICAAQEVSYDYINPSANFGVYKTYTWRRAEKSRYPDDRTDSILRQAVDKQMSARGFTRVDGDAADVFVVYELAVMDDALYSSFNTDGQWHGGGINSIAVFSGGTTNTSTFIKVGWLILQIYDLKQGDELWQISAKKTLGDSRDPKKMQKNADKVMTKAFAKFPSNRK